MVEYMKKAFGDMLLADYIDGDLNRQQLPSPEVGYSYMLIGLGYLICYYACFPMYRSSNTKFL